MNNNSTIDLVFYTNKILAKPPIESDPTYIRNKLYKDRARILAKEKYERDKDTILAQQKAKRLADPEKTRRQNAASYKKQRLKKASNNARG